MEHLRVPIPPFRLLRRIVVGLETSSGEADTASEVFARAVDPHDISLEIGIMRAVDWDGLGVPCAAGEDTQATVAAKHGAHRCTAASLDLGEFRPTLHFVGNYREPAFQLPAASLSQETPAVDYRLSFDPDELRWTCESQTPLAKRPDAHAPVKGPRVSRYGESHRAYCVEGVLEAGNANTRQEAEAVVARRAEEAKKKGLELLGVRTPTAAAAIQPAASAGTPATVTELAARATTTAHTARSRKKKAAAREKTQAAARAAATRLAGVAGATEIPPPRLEGGACAAAVGAS